MDRQSLFSRWTDYRLSRLELVFALIILLVLISIFMNRMIIMLAQAERSMIENSIVNLNSALHVQGLYLNMSAGSEVVTIMEHANPVDILMQQPAWDFDDPDLGPEAQRTLVESRMVRPLPNYAGELSAGEGQWLEPGSWYFDTDTSALVYLVRNSEVFRSELDSPARLRFRLELDYTDMDGDGEFSPAVDRLNSLGLQPLDEYQWLF
ncbi:MAG: hypothetical protein WD572_10920 [Gammaproteobacteria bacterium]